MSAQARVQIQAGPPAFLPSNRNQSETVIGGVATLFVILVALNLISRWMIRICRPNELLVVTGSQSNQGDQGMKGYRVVANGGWTFVKPILETARRMDVTLLPVLVEVNNAYSRGGTPLNIQAIANGKVRTAPAVRSRRSVVSGAPLSSRTTCAWVGASSVGTAPPGSTPGKCSSNSCDRSRRYSSWLAMLPMGAQMTHAAP